MKRRRQADLHKAVAVANLLNAFEVVALALIIVLTLAGLIDFSELYFRPVLVLGAMLLMVNNIFAIRTTQEWGRTNDQFLMIREALTRVEELNGELRKQRHDFMNHLQVVYSLLEMQEPGEAEKYIEKIHGQMQSRSLSMRTDSPAINALLQAKAGLCEQQGVAFQLRITSGWKQLPMPEWEMCRVLGNIIDNAVDALMASPRKELVVELFEDLAGYGFRIANSGPPIDVSVFDRMFSMGFTTKKKGQGLGLHIVKTLLEDSGGRIGVTSDEEWTVFSGSVPIQKTVLEEESEHVGT